MGTQDNRNGNGVPFRLTLRELPLPVRLVLSLFLIAVGLGYFSALVQLHFQNASPGEPLPTTDDVVEIFSGVENWSGQKPPPPKPVSKLEKLIMAPENLPHNGTGTMSFAFFGKKVTTEEERAKRQGEQLALQAWIEAPDAERKETYENDAFPLPKSLAGHPITKDYVAGANVKVKSIIDDRCGKCHAEEGLEGKKALGAYPDFASALVVPPVGHTNRQMTVEHLTQTTHLHLLSFCVLWMLTGLIFAFTSYPTSVRCILAPVVLLAQVADVSCWWLARLDGVGPYFALTIIGTGAVVGLGLWLQIVLSLFNMYKLPGRLVLLVLLGGAVAGLVALEPIIDGRLASEKAPAASAPAAPTTAPASNAP
jgi:hypothetical protein